MSIGFRHTISLPVAPLTGALDRVIPSAGNERMAGTITRLIRRRTGNRIVELRVEMSDDTVHLTGSCASFHVKQLAQHAAMDIACGATIVNAIHVDM